MEYFIGVDGGGTKTAYLLCDEEGRVRAQRSAIGSSYRQHGFETVFHNLGENVKALFAEAGADERALCGIALGLPLYGEQAESDRRLREGVASLFAGAGTLVVNDVDVGYMGSLAGKPGINIVAGTGSIAFGRDEGHNTARSGGWWEFFGDEGSCYWLGRMTMGLFAKEADGRAPRAALYRLVREEFGLNSDFEFVDIIERDYAPYREKVASLQVILEKAAREGDPGAVALYREAAHELALAVRGVRDQFCFGNEFAVSYSGGLFKAGELVLAPFRQEVGEMGGRICTPLLSTVMGAALLAFEQFAPERFDAAVRALLEQEGK